MTEPPIKICDYCGARGVMPTFMDGETVCHDCLRSLPKTTRDGRREVVKFRAALAAIKSHVCGDAMPRWENTPRTGASRVWIADVCDSALTYSAHSPAPADRDGGARSVPGRLRAERDALLALMQEFVDRVDRGEVRSVKTYAKFKAAIEAARKP